MAIRIITRFCIPADLCINMLLEDGSEQSVMFCLSMLAKGTTHDVRILEQAIDPGAAQQWQIIYSSSSLYYAFQRCGEGFPGGVSHLDSLFCSCLSFRERHR